MKRLQMCLGIVLVGVLFFCSTCSGSARKDIIGTWKSADNQRMIQFQPNGRGISNDNSTLEGGLEFTYKWVSNDKIEYEVSGLSLTFEVKIEGDTLTLAMKDLGEEVYHRVD